MCNVERLALIDTRFQSFPCPISDLAGAKSVYIITDVMKATRITACVTSDDDKMEVVSAVSVPIGFGYSKFRLTPEGLVAEQVTPPFFESAIAQLFFLALPHVIFPASKPQSKHFPFLLHRSNASLLSTASGML